MTAAIAVAAPIGTTHLIAVVVDDAMIPLDRLLGAIRRRNLPLLALSVGPGPAVGTVRVFVQLAADEGDVGRLVRQLRKLVGVHQAMLRRADVGDVRQLVLIRLTPPGARRPALMQLLAAHSATITADETLALEIQLAGPAAELERSLRALAPFGILDVARSSPVALDDEAAADSGSLSSTRQDDRS
ncbi:MAG: acetolactate synthase small subunit [Gemmatimonadota bacterium]